MHRVFQGAVPDVAYTDPGHGREMIVELKFINAGPTRYGRDVATSLRAAVNKREQQLYEEYLIRLRLKDRRLFHIPTGTVGPFFVEASLSIEHPLRTPPPDKPWARPTRTRVRTVHSAILRLAGVLHGHNLLRAPHKHLQRLCKIWSLVRRITSEVAAAGAAATVSSLSLSGMPIQCG